MLNSKAALIDQGTPGSEATRKRIIQLLEDPKLERVRFAVAFARWEGIGLIASTIENFVSRGGRFESIYGAGNGITTPDALYYGLLLRRPKSKSGATPCWDTTLRPHQQNRWERVTRFSAPRLTIAPRPDDLCEDF